MTGFRIQGSVTGNVAEVTTNNQLEITMPLVSSQGGYASLVSEIDPGTVTGSRLMRSLKCSDNYRLKTGAITPLFDYQFTATAQDTDFWKYESSTMTATQTGGYLYLNNNTITTTLTGVSMQTWRYFKLLSNAELYVEATINLNADPLANQVVELGLFLGTQNSAPADGVYFRLNSTGLFGVVNNNGTETITGSGITPIAYTLNVGQNYRLGINITQARVEFWIDGFISANAPINGFTSTLGASINTPIANATPFLTNALPFCVQQRNSGAVGGGTQLELQVGSVRVEQDDLALGMPFSHIQNTYGLAYQGLPGGIQNTLSNYTNNVSISPAVLSNTTANITSLGGIAAITVPTGLNTDGIIFAYQNPPGSTTQIPRTLVITAISIHSVVSTVLAATIWSNLYAVAFGSTAVALTTSQSTSFSSATTKAPKILPLGIDNFAASAAVGVLGNTIPIVADFSESPLIINPGEYVALITRAINGPPATGAITVTCAFKQYWI
jgi:hypothetical protein